MKKLVSKIAIAVAIVAMSGGIFSTAYADEQQNGTCGKDGEGVCRTNGRVCYCLR